METLQLVWVYLRSNRQNSQGLELLFRTRPCRTGTGNSLFYENKQ